MRGRDRSGGCCFTRGYPMVDPSDMEPGVPLLLEPSDAGRVLGLSSSRVRVLADEGQLAVAGRTRRGVRLFAVDEIERLRVERARRPAPGEGHRS